MTDYLTKKKTPFLLSERISQILSANIGVLHFLYNTIITRNFLIFSLLTKYLLINLS